MIINLGKLVINLELICFLIKNQQMHLFGSSGVTLVVCSIGYVRKIRGWILRTKASMRNAVFPHQGAIPISLSTTTPLRLRYRMLIANEPLVNKQIQRYRDSFFGEK